jgi:hypothetical protein
MPFKTPQYAGKKEALEYLEQYPTISKRLFMDEGRAEIERDYNEKHAQESYIKGWNGAWIVGQIGTHVEPEHEDPESDLIDGILYCVGCYEENPGAYWCWTPVRQSEHANRSCERCQKKLSTDS